MSENKIVKNSLVKIITYILFAVLILGLVGGIVYMLSSPSGIYVVYGEENITSNNDGILVEWRSEDSEITFTIQNSNDWGAYSVQECTVNIVVQVSSKSDFEFTVDGENHLFSSETDLTAAFVKDYLNYNGNGLAITADGEFCMYLIAYDSECQSMMAQLLSRVYGGAVVTIDSSVDLFINVYFAIEVISPEDNVILSIPFRFSLPKNIEDIMLNETEIYY